MPSCRVTSANIDSFRSKKNTELHLEMLRGTIGPLTSSYVPTQDWCTLQLKQRYALYFMQLKLECQVGGRRGLWSFLMNHEDPGSIHSRSFST
ncbi:Histone acetylation protein [Phytophthora palmivora]|uniref:Histone acetylation protein n=1 Tax=Phytophthora palmivora TaxID=4796 RepID=A0A2P4YCK8_9STRA|nr:Histone acetylation protein [Phytophthora palmivora]